MSRLLIVAILTTILSSPHLAAFQDVQHKLADALVSERSNDTNTAISTVQALLDAHSLKGKDLAYAWNILGLSYADREDFEDAHNAYQSALSVVREYPGDAAATNARADILSNFADLYSQMNQFGTSSRLRKKALSLYRSTRNQSGIAKCYANLAAIELSQKHIGKAEKDLKLSFMAFEQAKQLEDDDVATIYVIRGWVLDGNRKPNEALLDYQHALELWQRRHGDQYGMCGLVHMLIGKEYGVNADFTDASEQMQRGLAILKMAFGEHSTRYLSAELMYSRLLDQTGSHVQAESLRRTAWREITAEHNGRCVRCSISIR